MTAHRAPPPPRSRGEALTLIENLNIMGRTMRDGFENTVAADIPWQSPLTRSRLRNAQLDLADLIDDLEAILAAENPPG